MTNELKKKYGAFWEREENSCLLFMSNEKPSEGEAVDAIKKWTDLDYRLNDTKQKISRTTLYGDAFHTVFTNFGPGSLAACIGGNFTPADDTVWFDRDPIISDWTNLPKIDFDPNSEMWGLTENYTKMLCQNSDGQYYTSVADLGGTMDIIASLRGTQELLYDLYDYPDEIMALGEKIRSIWKEAYTYLTKMISQYQDGFTSWMPIWCEERYYPLQCDFSAMMSPDMFEQFILPDLRDLSEFLDRSVYHLDGPGEIPHLDHLLSLPRLSAVQWTPNPTDRVTDEQWFPMYEKIIAAGKGVVLFAWGCGAEAVENLLRNVPRKGLFISCGVEDEKQAQQLIELAEKL